MFESLYLSCSSQQDWRGTNRRPWRSP